MICYHTRILHSYWLYSPTLYISYPWLIYFATGSLYLFISFTYLFPPPKPLFSGNHLFVLCFYNSVSVLLCLLVCCFHILATVNSAAVTIGVHISFLIVFSFSLAKYPEVELLDCMVVLLLVFWGISMLFSIVATPIYIPWGSPFLHILTNTCCFLSFWYQPFLKIEV